MCNVHGRRQHLALIKYNNSLFKFITKTLIYPNYPSVFSYLLR